MPPLFTFCGLSDIGLSRPSNQDVWTALPDFGFFALADGMGGRKGGEVAAKEAIDALSLSIRELAHMTNFYQNCTDISSELRIAIEHANHWVYKMGRDSKPLYGMGTTLCCLLWTQSYICYAHVGDSRIYRLRKNQLELLTQDHSLFANWAAKKQFDLPSPPKNIITRALGTSLKANPEISSTSALPDDIYLLCSDGLSDLVELEELQEILIRASSLNQAASCMINSAKNRGGSDNITVLMIESSSRNYG